MQRCKCEVGRMLYMGMRRGYVPSHIRKNAMPRRSKMWGCQECRSVPVPVQYEPRALEAPKICNGRPPTIVRRRGGCVRGCTSLPCTSGTVRTPCPVKPERTIREQSGNGTGKGKEHAHVFPAEYGLALAAIDVSHGVVACSHLTVIRFTFDNVNPVHIHPLASTPHDRAFIRSYTSSNK